MGMSYILPIKGNDKIGVGWWTRSLDPVMNQMWERNQNTTGDAIYHRYSSIYNVKLKFDNSGYLEYIEFPNEAEATLFVLKWM